MTGVIPMQINGVGRDLFSEGLKEGMPKFKVSPCDLVMGCIGRLGHWATTCLL